MVEVTKEQFYASVGQLDVHPRPEGDHSSWETRTREVVGRTTPGYMCRDADGNYTSKSQYFVTERIASRMALRASGAEG